MIAVAFARVRLSSASVIGPPRGFALVEAADRVGVPLWTARRWLAACKAVVITPNDITINPRAMTIANASDITVNSSSFGPVTSLGLFYKTAARFSLGMGACVSTRGWVMRSMWR